MIYKKACVYIKKSIGKLKILTAKSQDRGFEDIDYLPYFRKSNFAVSGRYTTHIMLK